MKNVQAKARKMGVKVQKLKKTDLIRKIQIEEGNTPCFQLNGETCGQMDCCWRSDCVA
jgi:hypothetical protein